MVTTFALTVLIAVVLTGVIMSVGSRFSSKFMNEELWFAVFGVVLLGLLVARMGGWIPF